MVAAGRKPYLDFFVQQVPLYPLICGAWLRLFGTSWQAANLFSGLLICGSAALVARIYEQSTETKDYVIFWKPKGQGAR